MQRIKVVLKQGENRSLGNYLGFTIYNFLLFLLSHFMFQPTLVPFLPQAIFIPFDGNYNSKHAFFKNQIKVFEGKEVFLLNPSPTRFVTNFPQMMRTLCLKDALRGTVHLQEIIALKFRNEEGTVVIIKDDRSFHQMQILIKMTQPLLTLLRMSESNHPHIDTLRYMVNSVYDNIRMYMPELND